MRLNSQYAAEAIGTFILVFTGTAAVVFNDISGGQIGNLGIGLVFGLVVMALIYALGDVSGAHINPAVTLGFWASGQFTANRVVPYILSQCIGALLASLLLYAMFDNQSSMGATIPREGLVWQCFVLEIILTFILMFVILNVATGSKEKGVIAGIAIGGVIVLEATFAGPISGASMNPARSLGPAVASLNFTEFWVYLAGPPLGALLAVPAWRFIRPAKSDT
ncbi:MAG: MIP family channel protein [Verrucomicrobiota bacterium]|jgi:aquaporin Z|nr:MIP family channel protein [Verrucomicrobiota bacterium]